MWRQDRGWALTSVSAFEDLYVKIVDNRFLERHLNVALTDYKERGAN